mmetsp:Transcript_90162/g.156120  ORF Transcript_90162/g.156120 Transcript_90162/m.156120 type:complete len:304 (-) Transcript_90162:180-1091(-)
MAKASLSEDSFVVEKEGVERCSNDSRNPSPPRDDEDAKPLGEKKADVGRKALVPPNLFDWIPYQYRVGPWSPLAYLYFFVWLAGIAYMAPIMAYSYDHELQLVAPAHGTKHWWCSVAGGIWCILINCVMIKKWGPWPYASFTLLSWSLLTLRFVCMALGYLNGTALVVSEVLRFPTLIGASITTIVWNFVLQPVIWFFMSNSQRPHFVKFNKQFLLIQIHIVNLPLAILSHYCSPRALVFFDYYVSGVWLYVYAVFYLSVLDRKGFHLYPIFTPRTHLCVFAYTMIIGIHYGVYNFWQWLGQG